MSVNALFHFPACLPMYELQHEYCLLVLQDARLRKIAEFLILWYPMLKDLTAVHVDGADGFTVLNWCTLES
jgi:hypothetical protein